MNHELYIFGSITRGEINPTSDLDILVVPLTGQRRDAYPDTWSCYKEQSLRRLHSEGRLFAWHLFLDSVCIYSDRTVPLLTELGPPSEYSSAAEDIRELTRLLKDSLKQLSANTPNMVYELGIVHTCLRDIAMSASWHLLERPTFSQMAAYALPVDFPLDVADYKAMMIARHASTRGAEAPFALEALRGRVTAASLTNWVVEIEDRIR